MSGALMQLFVSSGAIIYLLEGQKNIVMAFGISQSEIFTCC